MASYGYTLTEKILIASAPAGGAFYRCPIHKVWHSPDVQNDICPRCSQQGTYIEDGDALRTKFAPRVIASKKAGKRVADQKKVKKVKARITKSKRIVGDTTQQRMMQTMPATERHGVLTFSDKVALAKLITQTGSYKIVSQETGVPVDTLHRIYDQVVFDKIEQMQQEMDARAADLIKTINSENGILNAVFLQQSYHLRRLALVKLTAMIEKTTESNTFALPHIINAIRLLDDIVNKSLLSEEERLQLQDKLEGGSLQQVQATIINQLQQVTNNYIKYENGKASTDHPGTGDKTQ